MITLYRPYGYDGIRVSAYCGRSIDSKPIHIENGATFKELDTGRIYYYDKENNKWLEGRSWHGNA